MSTEHIDTCAGCGDLTGGLIHGESYCRTCAIDEMEALKTRLAEVECERDEARAEASPVAISITKEPAPDRVVRLELLLASAEAHAEKRFALIDMSGERLVLTTSNSDNATPTPFEMRLFACFAKAWADQHTAFEIGRVRGLQEATELLYGDDRSEWPSQVVESIDASVERCSAASLTSLELTRVAMAPFGLNAFIGEQDATIWAAREGGPT